MAERLRAIRRFSTKLPCYLCGSSDDVTADHAAPQRWVYRDVEPPPNWPTVPICDRCKVGTDPADNELHQFVAIRASSESPFWPRFRASLHGSGPLLKQVVSRTQTAWDGSTNQVRGVANFDKQQIQVAVEKLARGLTWITGSEMQPPGTGYAWDFRVNREFVFEDAYSVREFEFGPRFRCAHGDLRTGRRWHITYADRVHFAIAYFQPHKLKTLIAAVAFHVTGRRS